MESGIDWIAAESLEIDPAITDVSVSSAMAMKSGKEETYSATRDGRWQVPNRVLSRISETKIRRRPHCALLQLPFIILSLNRASTHQLGMEASTDCKRLPKSHFGLPS